MSGGLISLVANGAQDVYLTGKPQITYFKVIYRRYTNFAMEAIEQPLANSRFGNMDTVQIQRNGDLAARSCLKVTMPQVKGDVLRAGGATSVAWVRRLGHALVREVKMKIGGMEIDKHVGTWLDIFWELTHTVESERGYLAMIGDVPEMTTLASGSQTDTLLPAYTLYIPLQFWFCRNYGLSLPLIALQYHEVRLDIWYNEIALLMNWTGEAAPVMTGYSMSDASILIDYVYLEAGERRKYAQLGHEYLIEQVQFTGEQNIGGGNSTTYRTNEKLQYNHPTKELIWCLRLGAFNGSGNGSSFNGTGRGKFLCYTNDDNAWESAALDYAAKNLAESCIFVKPSADEDFDVTETGLKIHNVSRFNCFAQNDLDAPASSSTTTSATAGTHSSSSGSYRYSNYGNRIKVDVEYLNHDDNIQVSLVEDIWVVTTNSQVPQTVPLYGSSNCDLLEHIQEAKVRVFIDASGNVSSINCISVTHTLSMNDVSVPVEDVDYDNRSPFSLTTGVHPDVTVTQFNNYGLRLDGKGNPLVSGNIQLNGHDRFSVQPGSYFNYYQTQNHHTRTPADGINVYSFALHPEKHQPSGTTNLSRIDSTIMNMTFGDSLRAASGCLKLDIALNTKYYVFAVNYNVLRVMSGMAGLAYSN
jgi:hypothetical protein